MDMARRHSKGGVGEEMTDLRWVKPLVTLLQTRADEERREALVGDLGQLADLPTNPLQT
jgi:hypothetical protein